MNITGHCFGCGFVGTISLKNIYPSISSKEPVIPCPVCQRDTVEIAYRNFLHKFIISFLYSCYKIGCSILNAILWIIGLGIFTCASAWIIKQFVKILVYMF